MYVCDQENSELNMPAMGLEIWQMILIDSIIQYIGLMTV